MKRYKINFQRNPLLLALFILSILFIFQLIIVLIQSHPTLTLFIILGIGYYLNKRRRLKLPFRFYRIKSCLTNIQYKLIISLSYLSYWDRYLLNQEVNSIINNFLEQNPNVSLTLVRLNRNKHFLKLADYLSTEHHLPSITICILILRKKRSLDFQHYQNFILANKETLSLETVVYNTVLYNRVNSKPLNMYFLKHLCQDAQLCNSNRMFLTNRFLKSIYIQKESLLSTQQTRYELLNTDTFFKDHMLLSQYIHHLIPDGDFDDTPNNYHIVGKDYLRDTPIENFYKNHFEQQLIKSFGGCARCKSVKMGFSSLEYDHFWLPKSLGGNFAMRHKNGYYVNNCVPLCGACNKEKSAKSIYEFYSLEELSYIIEVSQSLNIKLNKTMASYKDDYFSNRKLQI